MGVGVVLASMLFIKRMADVSNISAIRHELENGYDDLAELKDPNALSVRDLPADVEVYEINGPFFFGVADRLKDTLRGARATAEDLHPADAQMPAIDASGIHALESFMRSAADKGRCFSCRVSTLNRCMCSRNSVSLTLSVRKTCLAISTTL